MEELQNEQPRDGAHTSPWSQLDVKDQTGRPAAAGQVYDVIIIGAGITGISTALMLQRKGKNCLLIEAAKVGFGTTSGTSAHLNTFFDATYPEVAQDFGEDAAKLLAEAGKESMQMIQDFVREYEIKCDFEFKEGLLFSEQEKETKQLLEILQASRAAGIEVIETEDNGLPIPFDKVLRFAEQGQFHPMKYISALVSEYLKLGGTLLENTFVSDEVFENELYRITAAEKSFRAGNLVYATHTPPGINVMNFTCSAYKELVLGLKLSNDNYPKGLVYDMQEPYHYFRSHTIDGQQYLILGGEDHKTGHGDPEQAFANLEAYARRHYHVQSVDYRWSSQYYVPVDGLPYIGEMPLTSGRAYCATGLNGNGMMFGTLSARIISDQILGLENRYSKLFSPSRIKPAAGFSEFVKENADVAWHFVADRFSGEKLDSIAELKYNQGIIAEVDGQKLALHKDENGQIRALQPTCSHAGCIVNFNPEEKTWDCPCHGGRFDLDGKVITWLCSRKDLQQVKL